MPITLDQADAELQLDLEAQLKANAAIDALKKAIYAYERARFGSHVTQPLREALALAEFSLREVQS